MKDILDLNSAEAKQFFLKEKSYFSFELPCYFTFSEVLNNIAKKLDNKNLPDFFNTDSSGKTLKPEFFEAVNYKLLNNKDGEYAWRLFQLIHPVLYISLINEITEQGNWSLIKSKFEEFKNNSCVECFSIPLVDSENKSNKAKQINYWWKNIEQKSIALALDFEHMFEVDIEGCYDSIYTHSIPWALHTKTEAKKPENRNNYSLIGNVIDYHFRAMSNGQTNGIPQGSVLSDFIAEIVLGHSDELLKKKISSITATDYKILRYRDDYRIFVNNPQKGKEIIKCLSEVMSELSMKLNSHKTKYSNDVIFNSLKPDKRYFIVNNSASEKITEELLIISNAAKKYHNSGSTLKRLNKLYDRITNLKKLKNTIVPISILVDITFKNPRVYPITTAILSKLLSLTPKKNQVAIIKQILTKFKKIPNTGHLEIWLQRITIKSDTEYEYSNELCKKVTNQLDQDLWNSEWLKEELQKTVNESEVINSTKIDEIDAIIEAKEVALFMQRQYNY